MQYYWIKIKIDLMYNLLNIYFNAYDDEFDIVLLETSILWMSWIIGVINRIKDEI